MPNRRTADKLKLLKGTFQPCRAVKPVDPAMEPLPEPPRRVPAGIRRIWRDIHRQAPHLRAADQFMVEILASLMHEYQNDRKLQTARIGLMIKLLGSLYMTPATRASIPYDPGPNEYDDF